MGKRVRIAAVGLGTLEFLGILWLMRDGEANVERFSGFGEFSRFRESFDAFITDPCTLAVNLEFFLARRAKTLVVGHMSGAVLSDSSFRIVDADMPVSELQDGVDAFVNSLETGEEAGELSGREKDVIREIASGKTNKEIADSLFISVNTVITHRKNIAAKLGIKSASGISLYALMHGIIRT